MWHEILSVSQIQLNAKTSTGTCDNYSVGNVHIDGWSAHVVVIHESLRVSFLISHSYSVRNLKHTGQRSHDALPCTHKKDESFSFFKLPNVTLQDALNDSSTARLCSLVYLSTFWPMQEKKATPDTTLQGSTTYPHAGRNMGCVHRVVQSWRHVVVFLGKPVRVVRRHLQTNDMWLLVSPKHRET